MPLYCILPSGNASEFPWLERELIKRKVRSFKKHLKSGGMAYKINVKYQHLLPKDKGSHYLGDDNHGHSLTLTVGQLRRDEKETFIKFLAGHNAWISIYPPTIRSRP